VTDRSKKGDPHGWNTLENYRLVVDGHLERPQAGGFVIESLLHFRFRSNPRVLRIRGRIRCQHGLFVDVDKTLSTEVQRGREMVRTVRYAYHAGIEGSEDRPIFRYDNAHAYPGHPDAHHRHRFDHANGKRIDPPDWVGEAGWPHLSDVIDELQEWWTETGRFLSFP
jgi:hypothetical protein